MSDFHIPVMLEECIDGLKIDKEGTYVDLTFGGGGHSRAILDRLNDKGRLFAFDRDEDAINNAIEDDRFQLIHHNFEYAAQFLDYNNATPVDGILADLGVSSHQFNTPSRGFSIRFEGSLDMRMNQSLETDANELINNLDQKNLSIIFREYGELKNAGRVAAKIISARETSPITSTNQLIEILEPIAPRSKENKFYAQVFQALRIEVNQELQAIKNFLQTAPQIIKAGGRLVIMTYHSLEDRLVKNYLKSGSFDGNVSKDFYGNIERPFNPISSKPIVPSELEIIENPRSRSAKLRIAEKV